MADAQRLKILPEVTSCGFKSTIRIQNPVKSRGFKAIRDISTFLTISFVYYDFVRE